MKTEELIATLNLLCLPILGVLFGVSELLGNAEAPESISRTAQRYQDLTNETDKTGGAPTAA